MQKANTVAELAIAMPSSIPVLERLRIDYCCHGNQSISQACTRAGVTPDELLKLIESEPARGESRSWEGVSMTEVVRFILDTHHAYTRATLASLKMLSAKVAQAHGPHHAELLTLETLVSELIADLLPHMMKEEQILFPYIEELDAAQRSGSEPPIAFFGTARNPIRMMMLEHDAAGEKMAEIRTAANDFMVPADACTSYTAFYKLLSEFEDDLHRHIHLENNVLFPGVLTMEESEALV